MTRGLSAPALHGIIAKLVLARSRVVIYNASCNYDLLKTGGSQMERVGVEGKVEDKESFTRWPASQTLNNG